MTPVLHTAFDVAAYTRIPRGRHRVDAGDVDSGGSTRAVPAAVDSGSSGARGGATLTADLRMALGMLQRLEAGALGESRAMLATWTGNEARVTAFLTTWMVERHWQARALRDLLEADAARGLSADSRAFSARSPRLAARARRVHVDRIQPLLSPAWTALAGEAATAGHMARMAIQEASLQASLLALAPRLDGEAQRVVHLLAERHAPAVDFFRTEAAARITRSRREAWTARTVLALASPLDPGGVTDPDVHAALRVVGARPHDRAALHRARFETTRLLPGPDLPDPLLRAAFGRGARSSAAAGSLATARRDAAAPTVGRGR